jgi:hypothetical protein
MLHQVIDYSGSSERFSNVVEGDLGFVETLTTSLTTVHHLFHDRFVSIVGDLAPFLMPITLFGSHVFSIPLV